MLILEGSSKDLDSNAAVAEASKDWPNDVSQAPEIIFAFHSTNQNSQEIAQALSKRFPSSLIAGCTTAGEWINAVHQRYSLVLTGISSSKIRWSLELVDSLDDFTPTSARQVFDALLTKLNVERSDLTPKRHFCIGLIDGMTGADGAAVATMADELGNVPFLGGVAADDFNFAQTHIIANGSSVSGGAVFILAESDEPFKRFKHQHFVPGLIDMVITKADEGNRKVIRLNGKPAAQHYAELIGYKVDDLTFQVFSEHPVIYRYGGESYVRTITSANEDGSLTFYCTIEEGMVLNLCEHKDMVNELEDSIAELVEGEGKAKLLFMCNCSFRALEAEGKKQNQQLAKHAAVAANHMIGFDTYGELWNGLHMNQTLVGLALGKE